jgi:hypothetical protein
MDLSKLEIATVRLIEQKLFYQLSRWNDKEYTSKLTFCEREKLSKEIESLKYEYSTYMIKKPRTDEEISQFTKYQKK